MNSFLKSILFGLLVSVIGTVILYILQCYDTKTYNKKCKKWNENHLIECGLFLTGFLTCIFLEYSGISNTFCKDICKKK